MSRSGAPLSFEEFRILVAEGLQVDLEQVVPESSFVDDLFADSIRLVELLARLREKGIVVPLEEAWNVQTVGDAYRLYSIHASEPPPSETEGR